jgi:hypothetical protein
MFIELGIHAHEHKTRYQSVAGRLMVQLRETLHTRIAWTSPAGQEEHGGGEQEGCNETESKNHIGTTSKRDGSYSWWQ